MDLVRQILLSVEQDAFAKPTDWAQQKELAYHVRIMQDAGLIDWVSWGSPRQGTALVHQIGRLTWSGHEFLDATRDETIWKMAKDGVNRSGGSWTFSALMESLNGEIARRFSAYNRG